jgi:hypothetical protein
MEIPGLGRLELEQSTGWHYSAPVAVGPLPGRLRRFVFDDFVDETDLQQQAQVALRFAASDASVMRTGTEWVHAYYADIRQVGLEDGFEVEPSTMAGPDQVWEFVSFPEDVHISRDEGGRVYVDLECECSWEPEHGMQLVLEEGVRVTKVSEYDGHLTNAHAYNRPDLEGVVYVPVGSAS